MVEGTDGMFSCLVSSLFDGNSMPKGGVDETQGLSTGTLATAKKIPTLLCSAELPGRFFPQEVG